MTKIAWGIINKRVGANILRSDTNVRQRSAILRQCFFVYVDNTNKFGL